MVIALLLAIAFQHAAMFASHVDGERWETVVGHTALEASPRWLETDDNPPLPPREAIRVARPILKQMGKNADQWRVSNVSLQQVWAPDVWLYLVDFEFNPPLPSGGTGSIGSRFGTSVRVVVLMDGKAVTPVRQQER